MRSAGVLLPFGWAPAPRDIGPEWVLEADFRRANVAVVVARRAGVPEWSIVPRPVLPQGDPSQPPAHSS